ncbi:PREDICTED: protein transport protein yos1-like isoform X1 [Camelina sativa]|nr:PREDICTED: protein transport protein yos1-like isoform X1 [Camelina sativa]XP_010505404.1 PREDICTED: protein transport protein yos1-like isoform X1 [Camelina sativa]
MNLMVQVRNRSQASSFQQDFSNTHLISSHLIIMGFWTLMEGLLLFANALAILNEDRFLAPKGWTLAELHQTGKRNSLKGQIIGLIHACHYMRLPLMLFNLIVIVFKLFSG